MKNIFSPKLYLQGLRKVRNVGIAMAIIIIVLNALVPVLALIEEHSFFTIREIEPVSVSFFAPFGILMIFFAPLLVYSMFSFLNERRSSDFYHAIPQKRICVYISFLLSIMTWIVGVLLATAGVNAILWSLTKYSLVNAEAIWLSFAAFFIIAVVMASFMTLAMMITGTTISNCLVFLLLLLFVRAMGIFFITCLEAIAPMFVLETSWLSIFDLEFFIPLQILANGILSEAPSVFHDARMYVYWLVVSLVVFAVAGFFYCRRRSEYATKSAPNRILQHIYRIAVTLPFALLGVTFIVYEGEFEPYYLIFFAITLLVYVIYELITTKKIKNVLRSLPLLVVPVALCFVFLGAVHSTKALLYQAVPEEEEIESVALDGSYYSSTYEYLVATDVYVRDEKVIKDVAQALEDSKTWGGRESSAYLIKVDGYTEEVYDEETTRYYSATVSVKLKSGKVKEYNLYSPINVRTRILNAKECRAAYLTLPSRENIENIYVSFSYHASHNDDDTYALWSCFMQEYASLPENIKSAVKAYSQDKTADEDMRAYGTIEVSGRWNDQYYYSNYRIYEKYMPKTAALFRELQNKRNSPTAHLSRFLTELSKVRDTHSCSFELESMTGDEQFYFSEPDAVYGFLSELVIDKRLTDFDSQNAIYRCRLDYYFIENTSSDDMQWQSSDSAEFFIVLSEEDVDRLKKIQAFFDAE